MVSYIAKRIFAVIPIVLFAIFIMFVFIRLSPVDPAEAYLTAANIHPTEELLAEKRHEFGLDQPMVVQYVQTIVKVFQLDFGHSYVTNQPVWDEVTARVPATLQLAVSSIFLAVLISIPLGFLSAIYKNSLIDRFSRLLSYLSILHIF
ncbi:ABC transporter permease, partial [Halalkalibacterium halodurans]|nr:ABC transporter permease [Halalkalibacterium halodurans]